MATSRARTAARGSATPEQKLLVQKDPPAELKVVGCRRSDQLRQMRVLCGAGKHCVQPGPPASRRSGSLLRLPRRLSQAQSSCLIPAYNPGAECHPGRRVPGAAIRPSTACSCGTPWPGPLRTLATGKPSPALTWHPAAGRAPEIR